MKKELIIFLLLVTVSLASCGKGQDTSNAHQETLKTRKEELMGKIRTQAKQLVDKLTSDPSCKDSTKSAVHAFADKLLEQLEVTLEEVEKAPEHADCLKMCKLKIKLKGGSDLDLEIQGVSLVDMPFWSSKFFLVVRLWEEQMKRKPSLPELSDIDDTFIEELAKCLDTIIEVVKVSGEIGKLLQEEQG